MSEVSISVRGLSKSFRQYNSKRARVLDALGFRLRQSSYSEFVALESLSFEMKCGERVGVIGRNGAGKSTLLKLIAGILEPTTGEVSVNGRVQALMELGTGFHPEFSGRANVLSALAYQGATGKRAQALLEDVIDFAELDEFIDLPLRTYSAGMSARLGFSAATAIRPEILIVDEILGAGDAYFAAKCTRRMRALTAEGTTLLFVSHDMGAVQMICDRVIWVERGHLVQDGEPIQVGRQYAASIRRQEELKLRAINLKLTRQGLSEFLTTRDEESILITRLVDRNTRLTPVRIYSIGLLYRDEVIEKIQVGAAMDTDESSRIHLLADPKFMNWGKPELDERKRRYRPVGSFGGIYEHAPIVFKIPSGLGDIADFSIVLEHSGAPASQRLSFEVFDGAEYSVAGELLPADPEVDIITQIIGLGKFQDVLPSTQQQHEYTEFTYGERSASIEEVDFFDGEGRSRRVFAFQEPMHVSIRWRARQDISRLCFVICIYGMNGQCVTQVVSPFIQSASNARFGSVKANFDPLIIGKGDYVVSIGIFDGLTEADTVGTKVLEVQDRTYRLRIVAPPEIAMDRGLVVHPVRWQFSK